MHSGRLPASRVRRFGAWLPAAASVVAIACGGGTPTAPCTTCGPQASQVIMGAGDIGDCTSSAPMSTRNKLADLLSTYGGRVFAAGDLAYDRGSAAQFSSCYGPTWGTLKGSTFPVPGNHEYQTDNANPFFDYFGNNAGPRGLGYWSQIIGNWLVLGLNSEIPSSAGSIQERWLRDQLRGAPGACVAAIVHKPLFSSGPHGRDGDGVVTRDLWRALYDYNAEIVIAGHDHLYERFEAMDPDGRYEPARGVVQFVVGTGGAPLYARAWSAPNSRVFISSFGILRLTLGDGIYDWEFHPVGTSVSDFGHGLCH